ncbi:MAG: flagellar basal body rod protein FlgB [bacterium]
MPGPKLFGDTMFAYQRSLDFRAIRHSMITANIANVETPGFKAKDIDFETVLKGAISTRPGLNMVRTSPKHLEGGSPLEILTSAPRVVPIEPPFGSFDGNTVSIDTQMGKLGENSLLYQTEADILARLLAGLKFAVSEGGR